MGVRHVAEHEPELRTRRDGCGVDRLGWGRRLRGRAASTVLATTRMPQAEMEEPTGGALATERWAERGARDGMRPARRQLRPRDGRRASWVPQAIRSAPQPRSANVSSDRGLAGGRAAGWLRRYAIDFSPSRGPSLLLIRPVRVAGFPEASASAILPWLRRGCWNRARPNCWACRSDQGRGAAPWGEQIAQPKGRTRSGTGSGASVGRSPTDAGTTVLEHRRGVPDGSRARRAAVLAPKPRCRSGRGCDSSGLR